MTKTATRSKKSSAAKLPKPKFYERYGDDDKQPLFRDYAICRTGQKTIHTTGWEILRTSSEFQSPGDRMRYNSINITETVGGSLVLRIGFHSKMDDEPDHYVAWVLQSMEDVVTHIFAYDVRVGIKALEGVNVERLERNYAYLAGHAVGLMRIREVVA